MILNSKGEPVILNEQLKNAALQSQTFIKNTTGYDVDITTLTTVLRSVVDQKFFEIAPADFMPIKVGEGAWSASLLTYRSFSLADDFQSGLISTGSNNSGLASADTQIDSVLVKVNTWAKAISWSIVDLQTALKAGNWDLIVSKEKARMKNWQLGIQKVAFLGLDGDANTKGLLTQSDVTEDTSTISKKISAMTSAEFAAFCAAVYEAYRANSQRTAKPTHFIIPEADYNGLAAPYDPSFPIKTKLQALEETFQMLTMNKSFKILPLAYANKEVQGTKNIYTLLNYDEDSIRMDIPVDYSATLANSVNNFQFQNAGYGQFTGAKAYRPREMLYFSNTVSN